MLSFQRVAEDSVWQTYPREAMSLFAHLVEEVLHGGGEDVEDGRLLQQVPQPHVGARLEQPADDILEPKHCGVVESRVALTIL